MKKRVRKLLLFPVFFVTVLFAVAISGIVIPFWGDAVFSFICGEHYTLSEKCLIKCGSETSCAGIYTSPGKNFSLVGPFRFDKETEDFFFVNRYQVVRSAVDKGGDAWFRCGKSLFILDDLSNNRHLRTSIWDELKNNDGSFVQFDQNKKSYNFFLYKKNKSGTIEFSIPENLLPDSSLSF